MFQGNAQATGEMDRHLSELAEGNAYVSLDEVGFETFLGPLVFLAFDVLQRFIHAHALRNEEALEPIKQTLLQPLVVYLLRQDYKRSEKTRLNTQ